MYPDEASSAKLWALIALLALLLGLAGPWVTLTGRALADAQTITPTATVSFTPVPAPTSTVTTTITFTPTASEELTPSVTPTATFTPTARPTPTIAITATTTLTPTATFTTTLTPTATLTPPPTPTAIPLQPGAVVINEVQYDPPQSGADAAYEWLELTNTTAYTLPLAGWTISDNSATDSLPAEVLLPGGFLVIAASQEFYASFPDHAGPIAFLADGTIGNGLANDGDCLILRDDQGTVVDALSYGDDSSIFDPPCPDVAPGHSLERSPAGHDTDRADDFVDQAAPSPGQGIPPATPTPSPTPTTTASPTPTTAPVVPLLISEVLYDGAIPSTEGDEFVELRNPSDQTVDLSGYKVGDEEERGKGEGMVHFPDGAAIEPRGLIVVAKNAAQFQARFGALPDFEMVVSGGSYTDTLTVPNMVPYDPWASGQWALSNSGDEVLLLGPDDRVLDAIAFRNGDYAAAGVTGVLSAPEPRSLQRVGLDDTDDMRVDFAIDLPNPGAPTDLPSPPPPPPAPALPGGMHAYFGCLQAHSTTSDGSGPPRYAYAVGRANGLHFLALTDHSHLFGPEEWADLGIQARAATVEGAFVALRGFEWTHKTVGHIGVFETEGYASRDDPACDSLAEFYAWLAAQEGAIGHFYHPFADSDFDDFAYDPAADEKITLLEVGNGSGALYRTFEGAYLQALAAGWHVGAANNGDTETADWGADTPHRTGVVAPALTEADLLAALRARRTFATEDADLALALRAGEVWMGSVVSPTATLTLTVEVRDPDGEAATLELFDRNRIVTSTAVSGTSQSWTVAVPGSAGHFTFAKATQADGDVAYTSPLWLAGTAMPDVVLINEFLPAPRNVDWDGDGVADHNDEWVELYNPGQVPVGLGGWQLDDVAQGGSGPYTLPVSAVIEPGGFLVLFKRETGLALNNDGDWVRLIRPDGTLADEVHYTSSPGTDRSYSRTVDGAGTWTDDYAVTMGEPNHPAPEPKKTPSPPPPQVTIAETKVLPWRTEVVVEGQVTVPPGLFSDKVFYLQDSTAGTMVYLSQGGCPPLAEGDWVRVTGVLRDYHGEREVVAARPEDVQRLRPGTPLSPIPLKTGQVDEAHEGLLAQIVGRVVGYGRARIELDDGSGPALVYIKRATGIKKPWVEKGEPLAVVGVVSQYAPSAPYEGGYRLLPRYQRDIAFPPAMLPITGG